MRRWRESNYLPPPANEVWGKVMFLHLSVILFTGRVCAVLGWCCCPWGCHEEGCHEVDPLKGWCCERGFCERGFHEGTCLSGQQAGSTHPTQNAFLLHTHLCTIVSVVTVRSSMFNRIFLKSNFYCQLYNACFHYHTNPTSQWGWYFVISLLVLTLFGEDWTPHLFVLCVSRKGTITFSLSYGILKTVAQQTLQLRSLSSYSNFSEEFREIILSGGITTFGNNVTIGQNSIESVGVSVCCVCMLGVSN